MSETFPSDSRRGKKLTLESGQARLLEPVLWQHALHGAAQYLSATPFGKHLVHCHALQATGASCVGIVQLLEALLSSCSQIMAARDDDVITAVCRRIVDRFVFAHQDKGD